MANGQQQGTTAVQDLSEEVKREFAFSDPGIQQLPDGRVAFNLVQTDKLPDGFFKETSDPLTKRTVTNFDDNIDVISSDEYRRMTREVATQTEDLEKDVPRRQIRPNKIITFDRKKSKQIRKGLNEMNKALQKAETQREKRQIREQMTPEPLKRLQDSIKRVDLSVQLRQQKKRGKQLERGEQSIETGKELVNFLSLSSPVETAQQVLEEGGDMFKELFGKSSEDLSEDEKENLSNDLFANLNAGQKVLEFFAVDYLPALTAHTAQEISGEGVSKEQYRQYVRRSEGMSASLYEGYPSDDTALERIVGRAVVDMGTSFRKELSGEGEGIMGMSSVIGRQARFLEKYSEKANKLLDLGSPVTRSISSIPALLMGAVDAVATTFDTVAGTNYGSAINSTEAITEAWTGPSADSYSMSIAIMGDGIEFLSAMKGPSPKTAAIRSLSKSLDELDPSAVANMTKEEFNKAIREVVEEQVEKAQNQKGWLFNEEKWASTKSLDEEIDQLTKKVEDKLRDLSERVEKVEDIEMARRITERETPAQFDLRPTSVEGVNPRQYTADQIKSALAEARKDLDRTANMIENYGTRSGAMDAEDRPLREWLKNEAGIPEEDLEGAVEGLRKFRESLEEPPDLSVGELLRLVRAKKNPEQFPSEVENVIKEMLDRAKEANNAVARRMVRNIKQIEDVLPDSIRSQLKALEERPGVGDVIKQEEATKEFIRKRGEGIKPMADKPFENYKLDDFSVDSIRGDQVDAADFSSADRAKIQFWNDLSKRAGGEGLLSNNFDEALFKFSLDDSIRPVKGRQIQDTLMEQIRAGARAVMEGDMVEDTAALNRIVNRVVRESFPKLSDSDAAFKIKKWIKQQLKLADQRVKGVSGDELEAPTKPLDIKEGVTRAPGPNQFSDRLKPFLDVKKSLDEGTLPVKNPSPVGKQKLVQNLAEEFERELDNLSGRLLDDENIVPEMAKGAAWNETESLDVARDFSQSVQSTIDNMVRGEVDQMNVARGFPEATRSAVAAGISEGATPSQIEEVALQAVRANPTDEDQWLSFWRTQKFKGNIDSVQDADTYLRKFIRDKMADNEIRAPETKQRVGEYVRDPNAEGGPEFFAPTAADSKIDGWWNNSKPLNEYGVRKAGDIKQARKVVEENLGHSSHEDIGLLNELEHHLARTEHTNTESFAVTEALKGHESFQKTLKGVDDDLTRKIFGTALKEGRQDWVEHITDSRFFDEEAQKLDLDEIMSVRRGPAANLPPEEGKTYYSLLNLGVDRNKALNMARKAYNKRLMDELPDRMDDIQRVAFLKKAKEKFPTRSDLFDDAIERIEGKNFEEYKTLKEERLEATDKLHKGFETVDELIDQLGGGLPDEVVQGIREGVDIDDPGEIYRDWISDLVDDVDGLEMSGVKQYALDIHGREFEELGGRQYADVVDFVRSAKRDDYVPLRMGMPTMEEIRMREAMEEDIFDPSTWKNTNKADPDGPDTGGRPPGSGNEGEVPPGSGNEGEVPPGGGGGGDDRGVGWMRKVWDVLGASIKSSMAAVAGDLGRSLANMITDQKDIAKGLHGQFNKSFTDNIDHMKANGIWTEDVKGKLYKALDAPEEVQIIRDDAGEVVNKQVTKGQEEVHQEAMEEGRRLMEEKGKDPELFDEVYQNWRGTFDEIGDMLEKSNIKVQHWDPEAEEIVTRTFEKREHFFPRSYHPDLWEETSAIEKQRRALEEFTEADDEETELFLKSLVDSADVSKAGPIDFARQSPGGGEYVKDIETAARLYEGQAARRISEARVYGNELQRIEDIIKRIRNKHGGTVANYVRDNTDFALRGYRSKYTSASGGLKKLGRLTRQLMAGTKLTFATIPNFGQWIIGSALASDHPMRAISGAIKDVVQNPKVPGTGMRLREMINQGGYDAHHLTRQMISRVQGQQGLFQSFLDFDINKPLKSVGKIKDALVDVSLKPFNLSELTTRFMSSAVGLNNFDMLKSRLAQLMDEVPQNKWLENPKIKNLLDRMEKFGIEHGRKLGGAGTDFPEHEINAFRIAREGLNDVERSLVMNRFNRLTNFTADEIDLPRGWNHPAGKIPVTFMNFAFNFGKLLKDSIFGKVLGDYQAGTRSTIGTKFTENTSTSAANLATWITAGLPLGFLFHNARATVAGRDSGIYNDGVSTYLGAVGGAGIFSGIINDLAWGNSLGEIVTGAPGSQADELFLEGAREDSFDEAVNRYIRNWSEFAMQLGIPFGPFGQIASKRFFRSDEGEIKNINDMLRQATNLEETLNVPLSNIPGVETDIGDPRTKEFAQDNLVARIMDRWSRLLNAGANNLLGTEFNTAIQRLEQEKQQEKDIQDQVRNQLLRDVIQKEQSETKQEPPETPDIPFGVQE